MPEEQGQTWQVDLEPIGRRTTIRAGQALLEAARSAGVDLVALCGGVGSCESCRVRLVRGTLNPPTAAEEAAFSPEELATGHRLACQAVPQSDVAIEVLPESLTTPQRLQIEGQATAVEADPVVVPLEVRLAPPSAEDLRADSDRLREALAAAGFSDAELDLTVLRGLSGRLRAQNWAARLALRRSEPRPEVVALLSPAAGPLGLAVDLGTTKLAAYLVDLESGRTLAQAGRMNPQIAFGEDVIARIAYANRGEAERQQLQERLVDALNQVVAALCAEAGVGPEQVVEAVAVGNTVMHHLLAGLPVQQLGVAPYVPAVGEALDLRAWDLGLALSPGARLYLPPNIAGYVGADHVAVILATDLWRAEETTLALDIGTNTELSLALAGRLLCCSCASGPTFEGAHIHEGMRAAPGAIERVQIAGEAVRLHTIWERPPVGLCGSGVLDAVAQMYQAGILERSGNMREHPRVRPGPDGQAEFLLVPATGSGHGHDIVVTRRDVNEVQLAKGAIRAGIEVLLAEAGISAEDVGRVVLAGAFGTYLAVESALAIGLLPPLPRARIEQVGNAAGVGARQMLLSRARRRLADRVRRQMAYIELSTHPAFTETFMRAVLLG